MAFGRYTSGIQWHVVLDGSSWTSKEGEIGIKLPAETCSWKLLLPPVEQKWGVILLLTQLLWCLFCIFLSLVLWVEKAGRAGRWNFPRDTANYRQNSNELLLFRPFDVSPPALSPPGYFAFWLIHPLACSPSGWFAPSPWTIGPTLQRCNYYIWSVLGVDRRSRTSEQKITSGRSPLSLITFNTLLV